MQWQMMLDLLTVFQRVCEYSNGTACEQFCERNSSHMAFCMLYLTNFFYFKKMD